MAKKSEEYWKKRFEILESAQSKKGAEYFAELEKQYTKASNAVQNDINKWYARFANNNGITMQEAKKMLTKEELEEFKWSVMEYVEKGRTLNVSSQWEKQLENASARFHVTRLEALKIQMQNHVEVLYGNELDDVSKLMEKIYTDGYYHTAYEIQKGFEVGYSMMKLDTNKVEKVLAKPWTADGSNFSSRIWKQKNQLVTELHNNLTQAIIRGQSPSVVTEAISKRFNVSKGQAGRLVMTESAFFNSVSNYDCYKDLDVEQYEILATLDTKTSDICRELDGKVFNMSDYQAGVTAPPFHVWCRTTTVPYFNDEFTLNETRAFRDSNGKTDYVPASMKYPEWKKKYVTREKTLSYPTIKDAKIVNAIDTFNEVLDNSSGNPDMIERLIVSNDNVEWELRDDLDAPFAYDVARDKIVYNPNYEEYNLYDLNNVLSHELAHRIDVKELMSWKNKIFTSAFDEIQTEILGNTKWEELLKKNFSSGGIYFNEFALSDIFSALSKGKFNYFLPSGHSVKYWEEDSDSVYLETFANLTTIDILRTDGSEEFKGLLKKLYEAYKELVKYEVA